MIRNAISCGSWRRSRGKKEPWPDFVATRALGADGIALLNDVPVWYEIWATAQWLPLQIYYYSGGKKDAGSKEKMMRNRFRLVLFYFSLFSELLVPVS